MFDNVRLPEEVETGAKGGPRFQTSVVALASGNEQRNEDWADSRQVWDIGYGVQDQPGYEAVRDFFYARRAKGRGFLFKDWSDFSVTGQLVGTGDGTTRTFLLVKTYENDGPDPFIRRITRPVLATLNVYCDNVLKVLNTDYATGSGGWIRFLPGKAPGNGVQVTVDFEFDVPVRFDVDEFPLQLAWVEAGEIQALPIIELRDNFNAPPTAVNFTNTTTGLIESTSTAAHVHVADIDVTDDPFGTDVLSLTGADAQYFEIVGSIGAERDGAALYLKAGTSLACLLKSSYHVTVNVDDASIAGGHPQAFANFTLNITQTNLAPSISLYNLAVVEPDGTSTAAPIRVADVKVIDDGVGLRTLALSGADAAKFQLSGALSVTGADPATGQNIYTGVSLQTVAGLDYSVQKTFVCNVTVADAGLPSPPQGSAAFSMSFGVVPGSFTDTMPGTRTLTVPNYTTLVIDLYGAGAGAWGYNVAGHDGGNSSIASLGLTAGGGKTSTSGSTAGGAGGTATGGDTNTPGTAGANGLDYSKNLSTTNGFPYNPTGFQFSTAAGANNPDGLYGGTSVLGGFYTFSFAVGSINVNGNAATGVAAGGAGSLQCGVGSTSSSGGFQTIATYAKGAPGAGGGSKVHKVYIYNITAGFPVPGAPLSYTIGAKGAGGTSYANGGDGFDGKLAMSWS